MNDFKAIHDYTSEIKKLKLKYQEILDKLRYQLWRKSEEITKLEDKLEQYED